MKRVLWMGLALLVLTVTFVGVVSAQQPTPSDDDVNAIARQLFCPVCENTPLDVCPTQACSQWRDEIRLRLAQGWTEQQIIDYFAETYGIRVLAEPPLKGLSILVYIVPPLAFLAGAFLLFRALRGWQALSRAEKAAAGASPAGEEEDPYLKQLEEELKKRD